MLPIKQTSENSRSSILAKINGGSESCTMNQTENIA